MKEGEAVRFLKKFKKVKICEDGKLKYKKIADVELSLACNGKTHKNSTKSSKLVNFCEFLVNFIFCVPPGCGWYDKVICDGETVQDLHRWWFLSTCREGKLNVVSRSWAEVRGDPRFSNQ